MTTSLFENNLALFSQHRVTLPDTLPSYRLEDLPPLSGSLKSHDLNIKLDTGFFYAESDALSYAQKQCQDFFQNPQRIEVAYLSPHSRHGLTSVDTLNAAHTFLDTQGALLSPHLPPHDKKGEFLIVLGCGLGLHIPLLLENLPCPHLFLIEPDLGLLALLLHTLDFAPLFHILSERNGALHIFHHHDPTVLSQHFHSHFSRWQAPLTDGSYLFTHYHSHAINILQKELQHGLPIHVGHPKGFFEDEILMLHNACHNLTHHKHLQLHNPFASLAHSLSHIPCAIVGSGPSLDESLPILQKNQDHMIIFSCGTALGALLHNTIQPDFHCEIENTPGPAAILKDTSQHHNLKTITLIAAATIDPRIPPLFGNTIFLMRDNLSCSDFFPHFPPTSMMAPTVTNLGLRVAIGFGFPSISLFGTDLGSRHLDNHHSHHTAYHTDPDFFSKHPHHREAVTLKTPQPANFGGTAYSRDNFIWAGLFMSTLVKDYTLALPNARVHNCSDGIAIHNTLPTLPSELNILAPKNQLQDYPKSTVVSLLLSLCQSPPPLNPSSLSQDLENLRSSFQDAHNFISSSLSKNWHSSDAILNAWYDIMSFFQNTTSSRFEQIVARFYAGTLASFTSFALALSRRLPKDEALPYIAFMKETSLQALLTNLQQADRLIDTLQNLLSQPPQPPSAP